MPFKQLTFHGTNLPSVIKRGQHAPVHQQRKESEIERFLRLSSSFLIATQTMAALRANRSLMINQSKYALTPFTHSNKLKVGPRRTKWKMTEEGKTRAARCKAWLIECEPRVVRHSATQRKTAWSVSQGDIGGGERKPSASLHSYHPYNLLSLCILCSFPL